MKTWVTKVLKWHTLGVCDWWILLVFWLFEKVPFWCQKKFFFFFNCLNFLYNCLKCKNFARIWLLKMLSFWCQKNWLSLSIPLLLEVLFVWNNLMMVSWGFFWLNMCPWIMSLLLPAHFMFIQEILMEGFILKKEFQYLQLCESCSHNKKAIFGYFL